MRPPKRRLRLTKLLFVLVALAFGVPAGFFAARMIRIPLVENLDTYRPSVITRLYDRNGAVFTDYAIQRRIVIPRTEMSPYFVDAVIATEDANFNRHGGIDPRAILRAAIKDVIARSKVEGASTLTQQLAKQVFLTPEKSFRRKLNEMFLAFEIEKNFTKDQIFEMYANQVYLGHGAYGVEAASRMFFGKRAKDLTLPEAATLAGMIRLPHYYSPVEHPDRALSRRAHVLRRMLVTDRIDRATFDQAVRTPLVLGTWEAETPEVGAYFAEEVRQHLEKNYGVDALYQGGLNVYTTLDAEVQQIAENALQSGLRRIDKRRGLRKPTRNIIDEGSAIDEFEDRSWRDLQPGKLVAAIVDTVERDALTLRVAGETVEVPPDNLRWTRSSDLRKTLKSGDLVSARFEEVDGKREWFLEQIPQLQGAVVVLDVPSGEIRALVGGYDFRLSKFNRAVQSLRQTGSIFKPLVYGAAFEKGFTPADTLFDAPVSIQVGNQVYSPRNYYGQYTGIVTIQRALELSINVPAVKTFMMVGADHVIDFTRRFGITSDLPPYPSLSLGAAGVSPLEMTAAFAAFGNQGVYAKPRFIRRIADETQKTLEETTPILSEGTSAEVAYVLTKTLQGVIRRGTGYSASRIPGDFAGKTGTTNGFTDAWFVGYSPDYAIGVWVGYDDPSRSLGSGATGGEIALPVWNEIMEELGERELRDVELEFAAPAGVVTVPTDLTTGRRGEGPCARVVTMTFVKGTEPTRDCSGTAVEVTQLPYYLQRPFYEPMESEPTEPDPAAVASPGEGGETPPTQTPATSPAIPPSAGTPSPAKAPAAAPPG